MPTLRALPSRSSFRFHPMGNSSSSLPATPPVLLIVELEEAVRSLLKATLASGGFTVLLAGNGDEALEVYRRLGKAIDLVLMDVGMPELSGPQTLAVMRQLNPAVRCCFMTAGNSAYNEQDLLSLGALHVFRK